MSRWVRALTLALVTVLLGAPAAVAGPRLPAHNNAEPPTFTQLKAPRIVGTTRWDHTLTGYYGSLDPVPTAVRYQWFRDGRMLTGATAQKYRLKATDFGARIHMVVVVRKDGYADGRYSSPAIAPIDHRVPVSKSFTYSLGFRGDLIASTADFKALVQQTFEDPRGWRAAGIAFTRVARGGDLTVNLATSGTIRTFGGACSATWSCRSGRNVVINQTRWLHASPAWNKAHLSLRDYRHMVVNHETGHWLGHGHRGCPGAGQPAPVMMQQSISLGGCRFNPFPLPGERWTTR